jgi:hypothetical protein
MSGSNNGSNGLPCNTDAERFVLGAILLDEIVFASVVGSLTTDAFSLEKHRRIFRRMFEVHGRGERIDSVSVANELSRHGELESVGGVSYLTTLYDGLPHAPNVDGHVKIVLEKAERRRVILGCQHLMNRAMSGADDLLEIVQAGQDLFTGVTNGRGAGRYRLGEIPSVFQFAGVEPEYIRKPELPKGNLVVFTGAPEAGKSSLAFAMARDSLRATGVPCLALDRDNPPNVIANRLKRLGIEDGRQDFEIVGGWLGPRAPQPDSPTVLNRVKNCDPKPIIIVDNLRKFLDGGDENDSSVMGAFLDRCRRPVDLGATLIAMHNTGKDGQFYRGSSALHDDIDIGYFITNFSSGRRLDKLRLQPWKHRFGEEDEIGYEYNDGRFTKAGAADIGQPINETLTAILRLNPRVTTERYENLAKARGISRAQAREWLNAGILSGSIRRETGLKNEKRHSWASGDDAQ